MIERNAFGAGMAVLAGNFSRNLDAPMMKVYYQYLSSQLTTEEFEQAIKQCIAEETFWPPVAVILRKIRKPEKARSIAVDGPSVIRQIEKMATYNPSVGMIYPRVDAVRERLGEPVAYAYAAAGAHRLFSDNEISRDIATREFQKAMTDAVNNPESELRIAGGNRSSGLLASGNEDEPDEPDE